MEHLGDITKISGYTAPIVDCVIGGSPCQDLSIAGKRAGLDGERSGLFMEQIRIIKEMRKRNDGTNDIRPRYMVWENVPGAFSSNRGEDFRIVLEETAKVADENAVIPEPPKGKWTTSGCIVGGGWSIAWRVLDAQFWGVPQRRRRIALVADFGGHSAPEILFVRKGVSGDTEQGKQKRKDSSEDASGCTGTTDCIGVDIYNTALTGDKACPLTAEGYNSTGTCPKVMTPIAYGISSYNSNAMLSSNPCSGIYEADTSRTLDLNGGNPSCNQGGICVVEPVICLDRASFNQGKNAQFDFEVSDKGINSPLVAKGPSAVCYSFDPTASRDAGDYILDGIANPLINGTCPGHKSAVCYSVDQGGGKSACNVTEGQAPTLTCTHGGEPAVCYEPVAAVDCRNGTEDATNGALQSNAAHTLNGNNVVRTRYTVRRLTPLEGERLQGYPDGWTDIGDWTDSNGKVRKTSDAARYKALGNSIALPPWKWVIKRLCACYERDATMASLFDGISGFCLIWTELNGMGSVKWTSEIEPFPMAVCKRHFGDEETGEKGDFYEAILGRNKTEDV